MFSSSRPMLLFSIFFSFLLLLQATTSLVQADLFVGSTTTTTTTPQVPFDLDKFKEVLSRCRLQCPTTSPSAVRQGQFQDYKWPGFFELGSNADTMRLAMDRLTGERCELRAEGPFWNFGTTKAEPQIYQAHVKIVPRIEKFTILQIAQIGDLPGYTTGPVAMLGFRKEKSGIWNHLWLKIRADLIPDNGGYSNEYYDLGPVPSGFFDLKVVVDDSVVSVYINGHWKATHNAAYLNPFTETGWRTGPYLHDRDSTAKQVIEYLELYFGPLGKNPLSTLTVAPTPSPTSSPTWVGYSHAPTITRPQLGRLVLVNALTGKDEFDLQIKGVNKIDTDLYPYFRIKAVPASHTVGSVVWYIDDDNVDKENLEPFELQWNVRGDGIPWYSNGGTFEVSCLPYSERQARGIRGEPISATLFIGSGAGTRAHTSTPTEETQVSTRAPTLLPTDSPPTQNGPSLSHLSLINADTNLVVATIMSEFTTNLIDTNELPRISIEAIPAPGSPIIGSVIFNVDGDGIRTESFAPYTIKGDSSGDYYPWSPPAGTYTVAATPYSERSGQGIAGPTVIVEIHVGPGVGTTHMSAPTQNPTKKPTPSPVATGKPTSKPSKKPTPVPLATGTPTSTPTTKPSLSPVAQSTKKPTAKPTRNPSPAPKVQVNTLWLVDTDTDRDVEAIACGSYYKVPSEYNGHYGLRADVSSDVKAVAWRLNRIFVKRDKVPPYSYGDEVGGDYETINLLDEDGYKEIWAVPWDKARYGTHGRRCTIYLHRPAPAR